MARITFRKSIYEFADRVPTESGKPEKPSFKMKVDTFGRRYLEEVGVINTYEQIQSHRDSVDISYIMTRFSNGDTSVLSKTQGVYGDFTNIPTSLNELQQRVLDAERLFYQQPLEIREKFEHNPSMFYAMIGTESFNEIMGIDAAKDNPIANSPIVNPADMHQPIVQPSVQPTVQPTTTESV